jgi:hypothetical protein
MADGNSPFGSEADAPAGDQSDRRNTCVSVVAQLPPSRRRRNGAGAGADRLSVLRRELGLWQDRFEELDGVA